MARTRLATALTPSRRRIARRAASLCVVALLAAACAPKRYPTAALPPQGAIDGVSHRVAPGDTVYSLARRYGASTRAIKTANGLDSAYTIHVGQHLRIPSGSGQRAQPRRLSPQRAAPVRPTRAAYAPERAASPSTRQETAAPAPEPVRTAKRPTTSGGSGKVGPMQRPAEGEIVTEFGAQSGGARNDGIDIAAPAGAPVRAAADGQVAYVSDETSPLGSVVLLQHDGGMVTIYGRIDQVAVRQGQRIARGTEIARVASPRRGDDAALHFELRRDSEPVDPTPYI